jgi:hypothetical protein
VRGVVEREVQSEASEALQRLAAAESLKQTRIQREVDELARHAAGTETVSRLFARRVTMHTRRLLLHILLMILLLFPPLVLLLVHPSSLA